MIKWNSPCRNCKTNTKTMAITMTMTIRSDTERHSQFLRYFFQEPRLCDFWCNTCFRKSRRVTERDSLLMLWSGGSCWRSSSSSLRPLVSLNEANEKRRAVRDREWISWKDGVPDIAHTGTFPVWRHWGGKQHQVGWWWPYVFISMYLRIILAIERRWNVILCLV